MVTILEERRGASIPISGLLDFGKIEMGYSSDAIKLKVNNTHNYVMNNVDISFSPDPDGESSLVYDAAINIWPNMDVIDISANPEFAKYKNKVGGIWLYYYDSNNNGVLDRITRESGTTNNPIVIGSIQPGSYKEIYIMIGVPHSNLDIASFRIYMTIGYETI